MHRFHKLKEDFYERLNNFGCLQVVMIIIIIMAFFVGYFAHIYYDEWVNRPEIKFPWD